MTKKFALISTLLLVLFLLSPLLLPAQTAKVIQLSPEDAKQAQNLYAEKAEVEAKIADLQNKIKVEYLSEYQESFGSYTLPGWELGFEYSTDFKFIVPKPTPLNLNSLFPSTGNCSWIAPATGTITGTNSTVQLSDGLVTKSYYR